MPNRELRHCQWNPADLRGSLMEKERRERRGGRRLGSRIVGRCLWLLMEEEGVSIWSVSREEQGEEGKTGESGLLSLTLLISCAAHSGDLLLNSH